MRKERNKDGRDVYLLVTIATAKITSRHCHKKRSTCPFNASGGFPITSSL
jgi:hypothetical protein